MPTPMMRRLASALCLLIAVSVMFSTLNAQTNTENFAQFRFNFNNPGARATGIGGAFISIADDATASEANPAGLTTLLRPELSLEVKGIQYNERVDNFSHTGTATNFSITPRDFKNAVVSPSFAAVVFPWQHFSFSAYRYELINFESAFYTKGSYVPNLTDGSFYFPVKSDTKLKVINYGGTVAYRFSSAISVGVSAGLSTMKMQSSLARYTLEVFSDGTLANVATIDDSHSDFFINAGLLFTPMDNLSVGLIYKRRPSFTLQHTFRVVGSPTDSIAKKTINFHIPSSMGIGISYRPTDVLTLAFDAVRVTYSQLTKDFVLTISEQYTNANDFKVDDGMEFHGGAEYVLFVGSIGLVFRGGVYVEPDNRIRWVGKVDDSNNPDRTFARQLFAGLFQKGDSYVHGTFGLGLVFSNNIQVDVAGNLSKISNEVTGSLVVRF